MLRTLTRLFTVGPREPHPSGASDDAQLALQLDGPPPRTADELLARLRAIGLAGITSCRLTRNRTVMVSFRGGELRMHHGYLDAPPAVLAAIVAFVSARTRSARRAAQEVILGHTVARAPRRRRVERMHAADEPIAAVLTEWHARYNAEHFGGRLRTIPVRVSRRLQSRLGHYTAADPRAEAAERSAEIVIGQRHVKRHGWDEALHTLLHEMVHQWQDETGHPIDHGGAFRRKAREVGIVPAARRAVQPTPLGRAPEGAQAVQPTAARHFAAANPADKVRGGPGGSRRP